MNRTTKPIVLTLGDRYGVGPEIVARLLNEGVESRQLLLAGDRRVLDDACNRLGYTVPIETIHALSEYVSDKIQIVDLPFDAPIGPLGQIDPRAGKESLRILDWLAQAAETGAVAGAVYAPLNKQAMREAGHQNGDEFDYLDQSFSLRSPAGEINCINDIWTSRVSSHIPLGKVAQCVTTQNIQNSVMLLHNTMELAGHPKPKILVAGLNPHSGENGLFGQEELTVIAPVVDAMRMQGLDISGPFPADTIFLKAKSIGVVGVVTMYHDQGQIALKLMGLGKSVTLLAGFSVPFTTPGHGTAYDIVGTGTAEIQGLRSAISLCRKLSMKD